MNKTNLPDLAAFKRPGFAFAIASLVLALAFPRNAAAKDNWFLLRTKHFNVVSNADEGKTREMALHLEQFVAVFAKVLKVRAESPVPITVVVFKSDGSFKPFKPLYNGKPASVGGYFESSEDENIIALNIENDEVEHPLATIFHEYTHYLTSLGQTEWPTWIEEGLAEFYSSFKVANNQVTLGIPIADHVLYLRENRMMPIQSLIAVDENSPAYNERNKQGAFYAESWALVHYLMIGPRSKEGQWSDFLAMLASGKNQTEAFRLAFKTDFAGMEKELREYIKQDRYPIRLQSQENVEGEKEIQVRHLSDAESKYYLANLLLRTDRVDDAVAYFKQASRLDPALPGPYEGLGLAALQRSDFDTAVNNCKLAIAHGSKNHLAYYCMARALLRDEKQPEGDAVKSIKEDLMTSIKLMPGFAPSYHLFGWVALLTGENVDDGIRMVNMAIRLMPHRKDFGLTLAQLQMRKQDFAAAKKTLEPLLASGADKQLKSMAESLLNTIERYTASNLDEPKPSVKQPDSKEPASAPTLRRRTDGDRQDQDNEQPSSSARGSTAHAPTGNGPTLKLEGTEVMSAVLVEILCGAGGMVLVAKRDGQLVRLSVSDPAALKFLSQDPNFSAKIGCGLIDLGAYIHFKRSSNSKSDFIGDAVAVEFAK